MLTQTRLHRFASGCAAVTLACSASACVGLTPQLHPTDIEALEEIEDYEQRNQAYTENAIYREADARGIRYVKGTRLGARPRSWQSLDLILRSDRNSAAALPEKKLRAARVLTAFVIASGIVVVGGLAASARDGLDLSRLTGTGAVLLGGGVATIGFGIGAGVVWGQARRGYEDAVDVYNDSLALRLGISDAEGNFKPPEGVLVDEEGFIILDQKELSVPQVRGEPPPPAKPEAAPPPQAEGPSEAPTGAGEGEAAEDPEPVPEGAPEGAGKAPEGPGEVPDAESKGDAAKAQPGGEDPAPEPEPSQPTKEAGPKLGPSSASLVGPSRGRL